MQPGLINHLEEQRLINTDHLNVEQPRGKTLFLNFTCDFSTNTAQTLFIFLFLCRTFAAINLNRMDIRK